MKAHEMGTKWGESVSALARNELLSRARGTEYVSQLKHALIEAEQELSKNYVPFRIEDWSSVDSDWIEEFCNGVRAVETGSGWV